MNGRVGVKLRVGLKSKHRTAFWDKTGRGEEAQLGWPSLRSTNSICEEVVLGPGVGKRKERESGVFFHGSSKDQAYSTHCLDLTGRKEAVEVCVGGLPGFPLHASWTDPCGCPGFVVGFTHGTGVNRGTE